jgi:hypothetical protein
LVSTVSSDQPSLVSLDTTTTVSDKNENHNTCCEMYLKSTSAVMSAVPGNSWEKFLNQNNRSERDLYLDSDYISEKSIVPTTLTRQNDSLKKFDKICTKNDRCSPRGRPDCGV